MFTRRMENVEYLVKNGNQYIKNKQEIGISYLLFHSRLCDRPVAYAVGLSLTRSAFRLCDRPVPLRCLSCRIVVKCLTALTNVLSPTSREF